MSVLDAQFAQLGERYASLDIQKLASGTHLVEIHDVPLPAGWSQTSTSIRFLVPVAYPFAALDCFWADNGLRLASGNVPTNSGSDNVVPETQIAGLWFSWHLASPWNPSRDTLSSWMNSINDRMRQIR